MCRFNPDRLKLINLFTNLNEYNIEDILFLLLFNEILTKHYHISKIKRDFIIIIICNDTRKKNQ